MPNLAEFRDTAPLIKATTWQFFYKTKNLFKCIIARQYKRGAFFLSSPKPAPLMNVRLNYLYSLHFYQQHS